MRAVTSCLIVGVFAIVLTACGGGGGGSVRPDPGPGPIDPPGPTDPTTPGPTDPTDPPPVQRGTNAVPGIGEIPVGRIKVANSRMKDIFAIWEKTSTAGNWHTENVRDVACNSYTLQCPDSESFHGKHRNEDGTVTTTTGSAPYTSITDNVLAEPDFSWIDNQLAGMVKLKIVSNSNAGYTGRYIRTGNGLPPSYLEVHGAGNRDPQWRPDPRYPPGYSGYGYLDPLWSTGPESIPRIEWAIAANKLLLVAGWDRDANGNYTRHAWSAECGRQGISEGCLWAQFEFPGVGAGNSLSPSLPPEAAIERGSGPISPIFARN